MKSVGIITLTYGENYGNRLQNYAIQEAAVTLGMKPTTIRYCSHFFNARTISYRSKNLLKHLLKRHLNKADKMRYVFNRWDRKHMKYTRYQITKDTQLSKLKHQFDYFLCGSDQIWNPDCNALSPFYFAAFAEEKKRIALAASFGVDAIPTEYVDLYRDWLQGIREISVRELQGQKLIKAIAGRESLLVCDPVFSLEPSQWIAMLEKPDWIGDQKFYFAYFLGDMNPTDYQAVEEQAKNNQMEFYRVGKDTNIPIVNPSEFLWFLYHSEQVFTDSFHATSFSIIFQKQFTVFERTHDTESGFGTGMNSRILTLFQKFEIPYALHENGRAYMVGKIDWDELNKRMELERNQFMEFFRNATQYEDNTGSI